MSSIVDLILAETDADRERILAEIAIRNSTAPTDAELIREFLRSCTTLDGIPLTLDDDGFIVTVH